MSDSNQKTNTFGRVFWALGAGGGYALGKYSGISFWIPGIATVLLFLVFTKTRVRPKQFPAAIATTGGYICWCVLGGLLSNSWSAIAGDIILLSISVLWLWFRPQLAATLFFGIVQLGALSYNAYILSTVEVGSDLHRALVVHCIWRLIAIVCLVQGYVHLRRERTCPIPAVSSNTPI